MHITTKDLLNKNYLCYNTVNIGFCINQFELGLPKNLSESNKQLVGIEYDLRIGAERGVLERAFSA